MLFLSKFYRTISSSQTHTHTHTQADTQTDTHTHTLREDPRPAESAQATGFQVQKGTIVKGRATTWGRMKVEVLGKRYDGIRSARVRPLCPLIKWLKTTTTKHKLERFKYADLCTVVCVGIMVSFDINPKS